MTAKLSREAISSFVGDVCPLYLCAERDLSHEHVTFSCDREDVLLLHTFGGEDPQAAAHCALLTLIAPGEATVTCRYAGEVYTCAVSVRARKTPATGEVLQYFRGDFHCHTSKLHNHDAFAELDGEGVRTYLKFQQEDGKLDFGVISDHAVTTNDRDFLLGFTENERMGEGPVQIFPGSECEITVVEEDRFGIPYKNAGEIVTVNSGAYSCAHSWAQYFDTMARSPFAVSVLAHPLATGFSVKGHWNFKLDQNNSPAFRALLKGVEMGDGEIRHANALHEGVYSSALDNGFKVSTTCGSDSHGFKWGFDFVKGKTVIMAPQKSREDFLDALLARRFYATESGDVKVDYTVNGYGAASTLPLTDIYRFHIALSYFGDDPTTRITACRVISDYGKVVAEFKGVDFSNFDFELHSDTARYFYLRFTDAEGRRTWSSPVWTSREIDPPAPVLTPLDKTGFTVTELESGRDASVLVNGDPTQPFTSEYPTATYLIDMGAEREICALGHYTPLADRKLLAEEGVISPKILAALGREKFPEVPTALSRYACAYEIYTSCDGEHFEKCADGFVRIYSGETLLRFAPVRARYVKFKVLSNTGMEWRPAFDDLTLRIAELSLFV